MLGFRIGRTGKAITAAGVGGGTFRGAAAGEGGDGEQERVRSVLRPLRQCHGQPQRRSAHRFAACVQAGGEADEEETQSLPRRLIPAVGARDDRFERPPIVKLGGQIAAALIVVRFGVVVHFVTIPFLGPLQFGSAGGPVTVVGLVALMNVVNFSDGIDGLAAGVCAIAAAASARPNQVMTFEAPDELMSDAERDDTLREIQSMGVTRGRAPPPTLQPRGRRPGGPAAGITDHDPARAAGGQVQRPVGRAGNGDHTQPRQPFEQRCG